MQDRAISYTNKTNLNFLNTDLEDLDILVFKRTQMIISNYWYGAAEIKQQKTI